MLGVGDVTSASLVLGEARSKGRSVLLGLSSAGVGPLRPAALCEPALGKAIPAGSLPGLRLGHVWGVRGVGFTCCMGSPCFADERQSDSKLLPLAVLLLEWIWGKLCLFMTAWLVGL